MVEPASRFARDLVVQETGWRRLRDQGFELIAADSPHAFLDETLTAVFIRQVLGAVAQLDTAMTIAKLKAARDRKRARAGKCEGRKSPAEARPETAALARRLARKRPNGGKLSLRANDRRLGGRRHHVRQRPGRRAQRTRLCNAARVSDGPERSQRHGSAVLTIR